MIYKTGLILFLSFLFANTFAAKSIMFEDNNDNLSTNLNAPGEEERKKAYCKELNAKIARSKGKPLRRTELKNRYQEECLGKSRDSTY